MNQNTRSDAFGTPHIAVERIHQVGCDLPAHDRPTHLLILYQQPNLIVQRQQGNRWHSDRFTTGDVGIYPAGEYGPIRTNGPVDNIVISIHQQHLGQFADTRLNWSRPVLTDHFRLQDPLLSAVGRLLLNHALTEGAPEPLYAEALTDALCHHLLHHYVERPTERRTESGKLSAACLREVDRFLADHLAGPVTVPMLANLAHCSPFHFSRLFRNTTGCSPYQYVLTYKAGRAKTWLRHSALSITEIAYQLGFSSTGHFDRFFRRQTGLNPGVYRRG